jgi:ComF family protein
MSNHIWRRLTAFFFPPLCRMCNERQRVFSPKISGVLCPDCMNRWEQELAGTCPICGKVHRACLCMPAPMKESGCQTLVHLTAYRSHHRTAASALVLRCKDHNDRDTFRFLAQALSEAIGERESFMAEDTIVTYVPRRRAAVRAIGHDHAKEISLMVARELELPYATLLRRKLITRQQKELDAAERERNAAQSFEMEPGAFVTGKTVLLVDDICTTGSSLSVCTSLLLAAGARRVVCAVVAKTERAQ